MNDETITYSERDVDWRPLWIIGLAAVALVAYWLVPGEHRFGVAAGLIVLAALGIFGVVAWTRAQAGTVSVSVLRLRVGRESLPLSTVDVAYLTDEEGGGAPVGARVLGGGSAVPAGRAALPIRLTDGAVVLVPCRDATALRVALLEVC